MSTVIIEQLPAHTIVVERTDGPDVTLEVQPAPSVTVNPTGLPGASAYEIAVANGFTGTQAQWLVSLSAAAASSVLFEQAVPAATWTIPHTFLRPPCVQLVVDGAVALSDITFPPGFVTVTHAVPTAGFAILT